MDLPFDQTAQNPSLYSTSTRAEQPANIAFAAAEIATVVAWLLEEHGPKYLSLSRIAHAPSCSRTQ
jgi:hypothetical protein